MLDDRIKSFDVIDAMHLAVSFGNESHFIFVNNTGRCLLNHVYLFALNNVLTRWRRYQNPSMVIH